MLNMVGSSPSKKKGRQLPYLLLERYFTRYPQSWTKNKLFQKTKQSVPRIQPLGLAIDTKMLPCCILFVSWYFYSHGLFLGFDKLKG
jgi:hypothetical protein